MGHLFNFQIFSLVMSRWFPRINNTPTFDLDSINAKSKKQYEEIAERSRDEVVSLSQRKVNEHQVIYEFLDAISKDIQLVVCKPPWTHLLIRLR